MNKIKISPSILSADFAKMGEGVIKAQEWGADYIHIDIMDGVFVPNLTFGMPMVKALRKYATIPFDVHLMIVNPEKFTDRFIQSGADIITFHPDVCADVRGTLKSIRDKGVKAGLVINPDVDVNAALPYIDEIDILLLMSVFPGFGGQKFITGVLEKISTAKEMIGDRNIELEIDGGVTTDNIDEILSRGVNVVVAGSAIYNAEDPGYAVRRLRGCTKRL
ncbi:MAG: ribulose-phosphate 3-epimerase [Christensenellales bacterium]|jgi:ribulose-phosphate 3-epimerase